MAQRDDEAQRYAIMFGGLPQQGSMPSSAEPAQPFSGGREFVASLPGGQTLLDRGDAADRAFAQGKWGQGVGQILGGAVAVPYRAGEALVGGAFRGLGELLTGAIGDEGGSSAPAPATPQAPARASAAPQAAAPTPQMTIREYLSGMAQRDPQFGPRLEQRLGDVMTSRVTSSADVPPVAPTAPAAQAPAAQRGPAMGERYNRDTRSWEPFPLGGAPPPTLPPLNPTPNAPYVTINGVKQLDPRYVEQQEQLWVSTGGREGREPTRYNPRTGGYDPVYPRQPNYVEPMLSGAAPTSYQQPRERFTGPVYISSPGRRQLAPAYVQEQEQRWFDTGGREGSIRGETAASIINNQIKQQGKPLSPSEAAEQDVFRAAAEGIRQAQKELETAKPADRERASLKLEYLQLQNLFNLANLAGKPIDSADPRARRFEALRQKLFPQ